MGLHGGPDDAVPHLGGELVGRADALEGVESDVIWLAPVDVNVIEAGDADCFEVARC